MVGIQCLKVVVTALMLIVVACTPAAPPAATQAPAPATQPAPTAAPNTAPTAAAKPTAATAATPAPTVAPTQAPTIAPTAVPKPAPTAPPALTTVRYGLPTAPPSITTVGIYFAVENGFFKEEGLDVQVTPYNGAVTAVRALLSRDADIVLTGGDTSFLAQANGAPIKIITSPVSKGTDSIVADKSVASFKNLAGKQYAVANPGDTSYVTARILATRNGIDPDSIDFLAVGGPAARAQALLGGKVSASAMTILILQPILDAIDKGDVKVLTTLAKEFPDLPLAYDITRDDIVQSQGGMLTKFVKAELKGYRWVTQNPVQAATIAEKYIAEVPHDLMTRGMKGLIDLGVYGLDGGITLDGIDRTQKLLVDLGAMKSTIRVEDVATTQFVDAAVKDLGPAQ